jgi:hypothetical protein
MLGPSRQSVTVHLRLIKRQFFEIDKITKQVKRAKDRRLNQVGGYIRKTARSLLKRAEGSSKPGRPPHIHSGKRGAKGADAGLKFILYGKRREGSIIVGPVGFNRPLEINGVITTGGVPDLMEHGGEAKIREKKVGRNWHRYGPKSRPRPGQQTRVRVARYAPRPTMGLALQAAVRAAPQLFEGMVSDGGGVPSLFG